MADIEHHTDAVGCLYLLYCRHFLRQLRPQARYLLHAGIPLPKRRLQHPLYFLSSPRHHALDGRLRTASTMTLAGLVALATVGLQGGFHFPVAAPGWWGLAALTFLYGTAFTIMFTVLPKLGVAGNSAIMNVEPVFALALAWLILGQSIASMQVAGALLVVATVIVLGLRRR